MVEVVRVPSAVEPLPSGQMGALLSLILNRANRYMLTEYVPTVYPGTGPIVDFGGTGEHSIRHPGAAALGIAAGLATGTYDASVTGVPVADARDTVARLVSSIAAQHRANGGGWGGLEGSPPPATGGNLGWQEALWAFLAGTAGWLTWGDLTTAQRDEVVAMVVWEADRMLSFSPVFWKGTDGTEQYPGDSKAEELAWDASILSLAVVMLPHHGNAAAWTSKLAELGIATAARPSDLTNDDVINGRRVSSVLTGWNVEDNGLVINHGIVHPDYMVSGFASLWSTAGLFGLADAVWPVGAAFNVGTVYGALSTVVFEAPPYDVPGGSIYPGPGVPDFYYPEGVDWGTHRTMDKATADVVVAALGWDAGLPSSAESWALLHLQKQADLQGRFTTGQTYTPGNLDEDDYGGEWGREAWVAHHAGLAMLSLCSVVVSSNDSPYALAFLNRDRGRLFESTEVPATGGIELEVLDDPVAAVGVTVRGLTSSTASVLTVERRVSGEDWTPVPGMVERAATAAFYDVDYAAPLGVPVEYRVVMLSGPEPLVLTGTVQVDSSSVWLQDPVNPRTAVEVARDYDGARPVLAGGSFRKFNRPLSDELVGPLGASLPVGLGGIRQAPRDVPFGVLTLTAAQTRRLEVLLATAYPLLVRTPPAVSGLPRVAYMSVKVEDTRYDEDEDDETGVVEWALSGSLVRAPTARVIVGRWTYADLAELWPGATYGQMVAAKGGTYLDFIRDPSGSFVVDTTPPSGVAGLTASVVSSTVIDLSWDPATDDVGVAGYEYRINGGVPNRSAGSATTARIAGLTPSTSYDFEVRAIDVSGNLSAAWSPVVSATTDAAPVPDPYAGPLWVERVLELSPALFWRLGETAGTFADSSGNGRAGTLDGTAGARGVDSLVTGDVTDKALRLAGAGRVRIDAASWMDNTTYTVIVSVEAAASAAEQHIVTRSPGVFHLALSATSGVPKMGVYGGSSVGDLVATTNVRDGLPHLIVAVVSASGSHALYVDGVLEDTLDGHAPVSPTGVLFSVGNRGGADTHWYTGDVDDVVFLPGVALDAVQVGVLHSAWVGLPPETPTNLAPDGATVDASVGVALTWQHNDRTEQTAYEVLYREVGAGSWSGTGKVASSAALNQRNNLVNGTAYEWQVRTWGAHADPSAYSEVVTFTTG